MEDQEFDNRMAGHQAAMIMLFQLSLECDNPEGTRKLVNARAAIQADFVRMLDGECDEEAPDVQ
jgi:hypothetical protein